MSKKLATFVHVIDDEGTSHAFGPDDNVPAWAVKKITNPLAWADSVESAEEPEPAAAVEPVATASADADLTATTEETRTESEIEADKNAAEARAAIEVPIPPKTGPKATTKAWTEYALAKGFGIEGDASRKEIIDALDAEGIPTE